MRITVPSTFPGLDANGICRIWTQDADGYQRRMANRGKVFQDASMAINHIAGRSPRMLFCQAWDNAMIAACNSTPTLETRWIDNVANARDRDYRVLSLPRDSDIYNSDEAGVIYTNAAGSTNIESKLMSTAPSFPSDAGYAVFRTSRGNASNAVYTEALSTINGIPLVDVVCQEAARTYLDDNDTAPDLFSAVDCAPGTQVLSGPLENCRATFHTLRQSHNRLVACFLGVCSANARTMLTGTNAGAAGFWTNSATYVNVLDQSVASRTQWTPGIMAPAYKAGVGQSNGLGVTFYALARKGTSNANGSIKIVGPTHRASNEVEITVSAETPTWVSGGPVYLNTEVEDTDVTTARNKLDAFIKAGNAGEEIAVYSLLAFTTQTG